MTIAKMILLRRSLIHKMRKVAISSNLFVNYSKRIDFLNEKIKIAELSIEQSTKPNGNYP